MSALQAQKYSNPSRAVSGTVTVRPTDVILRVNTSGGVATINLPSIPVDKYPTTWRLYVYDASGNAATNNITIVAGTNSDGTAQTINGASTLVISTNGVRAIIEISSNTSFNALLSNFNAGVTQAYQTIQDEGAPLTQRSTMDFVGSGVTVTDNGSKTVITIPGGISQAYQTAEDEGVPVAQRSTMNFVGSGVTVTDSGGKTIITIPGGISQAYQTFEDEGSPLTQRSTANFVGPGVTVTDSGGKTVITISGGLTSVTNAQLLTLISGATVVPGQFYLVTDGGNSNGGVIVQGETARSVTRFGAALFLNANYQLSGSPPGGGSWKGIWSTVVVAVAAGDAVIYNNSHYENLTGSWGSAPSGDAVNWSLLSKSTTNGYILEVDYIEYNPTSNLITFRKDTRGNEVDRYVSGGNNAIVDFQWGRDAATYNVIRGQSVWNATNSNATLTGNKIDSSTFNETTKSTTPGNTKFNTVSGGSTLTVSNCLGSVSYNEVRNASSILCNGDISVNSTVYRNIICEGTVLTLNALSGTSTVNDNTAIGGCTITSSGTINNGNFIDNYFSNDGVLTFTELNGFNISGCEVSDDITAALGAVGSSKTNYKVREGYSSWVENLDFSSGSIFTGTTLTIPSAFSYVGIFITSNATGTNTVTIVNAPTNHEYTIRPSNGDQFQITATAVAGATAGQILASTIVAPFLAVGRTNGGDELIFKRFGTLNGLVEQERIWA